MIADAVKDAINTAFGAVSAKFAALFAATFSFFDPFWGYVPLAVAIIAGLLVLCYFFGSWLTSLRPIVGGIVLIILALLFGYRRGEREAREYDAKKHKKR